MEKDDINNNISKKKRYQSIDIFKSLLIILMVFVNSLPFFENIPNWSKHSSDYGLTYVDLIAPCFIFIMALNFNISFNRRIKLYPKKEVYIHYIKRNLILIGIGLFLYLDFNSTGIYIRWGILQVLGMSGLILLITFKLHFIFRMSIGLIFIILHQYLLFTYIGDIIFEDIEGGFYGSLSWGAMIIFSSLICDGFMRKNMSKYFVIIGITFFFIGIITSFRLGISRFGISLPFTFLSVGFSSLLYYSFYYIIDGRKNKVNLISNDNLLSIIGKNSLILFIAHFILISYTFSIFSSDLNVILAYSIAIINCIIIWIISYILFHLKIFVKL